MLSMRTFKLDQPSYLFFDITWADLILIGLLVAFVGFLTSTLGLSLGTSLFLMALSAAGGYLGKRAFLAVFPHGTHTDFARWVFEERYFYDHGPDPVNAPLVYRAQKELPKAERKRTYA
ncbi:hypothetical protein HRbin39_00031 [bacterium HR39]|nr:hypothetical protein HRbin39_00031 [bacterium HR39]